METGIVKSTARKGGRPCPVAVMYDARLDVTFYEQFYAACSTFGYRDIMAVSRRLDVSPRTVRNWKYHKTLPVDQIVFAVVEWVKEGKPTEMVPPDQIEKWRGVLY
jgi:hypothetical protein